MVINLYVHIFVYFAIFPSSKNSVQRYNILVFIFGMLMNCFIINYVQQNINQSEHTKEQGKNIIHKFSVNQSLELHRHAITQYETSYANLSNNLKMFIPPVTIRYRQQTLQYLVRHLNPFVKRPFHTSPNCYPCITSSSSRVARRVTGISCR